MDQTTHIFHVFSTFGPGGPQVRTVALINSLGPSVRHTIVAMDRAFGAATRLAGNIRVRLIDPPPKRNGLVYPLVLCREIAAARPDLVVTYNWGAIEATMGAALASHLPIIHLEHGFGRDEAVALKRRRVLLRRFVLNRIYATVVPSATLLEIALKQYRIKPSKVHWIPNGVDTEQFAPRRDWEQRHQLGVADDEVLVGYVGHLRPEKNLTLLLRAFAAAQVPFAKLVLLGQGDCERELRQLAKDLKIEQRVVFAGPTDATLSYYSAMDVFALSSVTEQMPMSLLEAMACGLPAICTAVGDVGKMLGAPDCMCLIPSGDLQAYSEMLSRLIADSALRRQLGASNRQRCVQRYSVDAMITRYTELYAAATGREQLLRRPDDARRNVAAQGS